MSKPFSLKYKVCYQNKLNFWDSIKISNFKRKKWNLLKFRKKQINFSPLFFSGKVNLQHFHKNILFLKRFLRYYSCRISSSQLKKLFRMSKGKTLRYLYFLNLLESRLDVVLFRSGICATVFQARQLIAHKKVSLNGQVIKNPNILLKPYDLLSLDYTMIAKIISKNELKLNIIASKKKYSHLEVNYNTLDIMYLGPFNEKNIPFESNEGYHFINFLYN